MGVFGRVAQGRGADIPVFRLPRALTICPRKHNIWWQFQLFKPPHVVPTGATGQGDDPQIREWSFSDLRRKNADRRTELC